METTIATFKTVIHSMGMTADNPKNVKLVVIDESGWIEFTFTMPKKDYDRLGIEVNDSITMRLSADKG